MSTSYNHEFFDSDDRGSLSLSNDRCQNILYKAVFEHFAQLHHIAALLLASKSFQNSSFGANFLVNSFVDGKSIRLIDAVLSPSSCFSLQFVPSLRISRRWTFLDASSDRRIFNFVDELVKSKYLRSSLRSLTLNSAHDDIVSRFFGCSTINAWPQLHDLTMKESGLNNSDVAFISKNALHLRTLNLSKNSGISHAALQHISEMSSVTSLNLSSCDNITESGLAHLSKLSNNSLYSLDLSFCDRITDAALDRVAKISSITSLNLHGCGNITDAGLAHLAQLSNITSLNLEGCEEITGTGFEKFPEDSTITILEFHLTRINDAGLEHISRLANVTSLNLAMCNGVTDVGAQYISQLSNITSLNLQCCDKITEAGIEHLSRLVGITFLNLSECFEMGEASIEHISKLSNITSLNLSQTYAIWDHHANLEQLCSKLSKLISLDLAECGGVTEAGLVHISKLPGITWLNIFGCNQISEEAKATLGAAMPNCEIIG